MRAMGFFQIGPPDVLQQLELDRPSVGPGEVRIRVKAVGVLPFDCKLRSGFISLGGKSSEFPIVPGNEFAGIVDQIGVGVKNISIGQEVLGFGLLNSYAEYLTVRADQVVPKPSHMPWEVAGGFSGNGQGAHMAISDLNISEGDTVLIHAAAGGFGTFAVQLARLRGAKLIIGTASERNHDYLRALGVIPVSYGAGLEERVSMVAPDGVDAALDAAGPSALEASLRLVKHKERIRTMVSMDLAHQLGIPPLKGERSADRLQELVELYTLGKLKIHIRKSFPLDQAVEAHREVESGHGRGKVVLVV